MELARGTDIVRERALSRATHQPRRNRLMAPPRTAISPTVHEFEKDQVLELKAAFAKDIALALAKFQIWLLLSILTNIVMIGLPALYVFFNTTTTASTALKLATQSAERLNERSSFINRTDGRLVTIERYLKNQQLGFEPFIQQETPQ